MKSAGYCRSSVSEFSKGKCHCAKDIDPESNQASMTSGVRFMVPPQPLCEQGQVYASMKGLCGSKSAGNGLPAFWASSVNAPTASTCFELASHIHTGSGVPQYRSREIAQSTLFLSHSPNRPERISGGCHSTNSFRADISSL